MKKILFIIIMVLLLASCTLAVFDEDGFRLFAYSQFLTETNVCVQSHDGYKVDDMLYIEGVFNKSVTIINVLSHDINVKITDFDGSRWVVITDFLVLED